MGMFFTVRQNGMLDGVYNHTYGLSLTMRNPIQRYMTEQTSAADMQRAVQVVFRNMVNIGNYMNSHPGVDGVHIPCFDSAILLLEASHSLQGIYSSKG